MAKNSWPSSRASFSALALSPSVMAMSLLPISLMSDHGKPWAIDSDSTPSLPSMACSLSTKPRIGWRVVWNTPIMLAVPRRHHRLGAALDGAFHHVEQVVGALRHVDMRVFLEQHQGGGVAQGALADVAMQVELDADRHVRARRPCGHGPGCRFRSRRSPRPPWRRAWTGTRRRPAAPPSGRRRSRHGRLRRPSSPSCRPAWRRRTGSRPPASPWPRRGRATPPAARRTSARSCRSCLCGRGRSPRRAGGRWGWTRRCWSRCRGMAVKIFFMPRS